MVVPSGLGVHSASDASARAEALAASFRECAEHRLHEATESSYAPATFSELKIGARVRAPRIILHEQDVLPVLDVIVHSIGTGLFAEDPWIE